VMWCLTAAMRIGKHLGQRSAVAPGRSLSLDRSEREWPWATKGRQRSAGSPHRPRPLVHADPLIPAAGTPASSGKTQLLSLLKLSPLLLRRRSGWCR
jgi:hypothetical protein